MDPSERENVLVMLDSHRHADQAAMREERLRRSRRSAGVPERFVGKGFADYLAADEPQRAALAGVRDYADGFGREGAQGRCLLMLGTVGTGKTHLACALVQAVMDGGRSARYLTAMDLSAYVREAYDRDSMMTERQALAEFAVPTLLVIDEVGRQRSTEFEQLVLWQVINARYERQLPTVLVSNLNPQRMEDFLGASAMDRLREDGGQKVVFNWLSFRQGGRP